MEPFTFVAVQASHDNTLWMVKTTCGRDVVCLTSEAEAIDCANRMNDLVPEAAQEAYRNFAQAADHRARAADALIKARERHHDTMKRLVEATKGIGQRVWDALQVPPYSSMEHTPDLREALDLLHAWLYE